MIIYLKNKHTLKIDSFNFRCCIGKKGLAKKKIEGDKHTPIGMFHIGPLYFRNDRIKKLDTKLKCIRIKKSMGWCDDVESSRYYNRLISTNNDVHHERLFRKDNKYDLLIPIKYNFDNPVVGRGSAIFIHLTKDYKPTAGCIALIKKDFLIMLKLIRKNSKIKII